MPVQDTNKMYITPETGQFVFLKRQEFIKRVVAKNSQDLLYTSREIDMFDKVCLNLLVRILDGANEGKRKFVFSSKTDTLLALPQWYLSVIIDCLIVSLAGIGSHVVVTHSIANSTITVEV